MTWYRHRSVQSRCLGTLILLLLLCTMPMHAATTVPAAPATPASPQLVFIDTDIGDDIDDAFAIALALQSPELHILGITTTFGDTATRAHLLRRLLVETGHADIPIAAGPPTLTDNPLTQRPYADRDSNSCLCSGQSAHDLFGKAVRAHPHEITLIALGPLTTVESLLDEDPVSFHLLKRIVMMGGSIAHGYRHTITGADTGEPSGADPEWNIVNGISGAQKLLQSGIPLTLLPLDSTQVPLDEFRRQRVFAHGSALTDALTLLYHQWGGQTPILFDPLTVATVLHPELCPTEPMRLRVEGKGYTRRELNGPPNAQVCLRSNRDAFLDLLMSRLVDDRGVPGGCMCAVGH